MSNENGLELDAETMRQLGYRVVDLLVDRISRLDGEAAWRGGDRAVLENVLREPPPESPGDFDSLARILRDDVLPFAARVDHPRFLGFVPGSPTWPAILGDFIASGYNIFEGSWLGGSGASVIELVVLDWFKEWIGYPGGAGGLFTSGGSAANLTAIACARQIRFGAHEERAVLYYSAESHSSVERAARTLGFAPDRMRRVAADSSQRLDPAALEGVIDDDTRNGLLPFLVLANAGTTSTGAVDPMDAVADIAQRNGCWFHADAAYGGFAVLTSRGRSVLAGIARADSITLDPHKWLFQPFEAGCLLVRRSRDLESAFRVTPDYLRDAVIEADTDDRTGPVNFMDRGIQLTRAAKALKVWLSLKHFGVAAFRAAIDRAIDLAAFAEERLRESGRFEILSPARLGIVCFRRIANGPLAEPASETMNAGLVRGLADSGLGLISSTRVNGCYALRFCILGHRTKQADIERVVRWLEDAVIEAAEPVHLPESA